MDDNTYMRNNTTQRKTMITTKTMEHGTKLTEIGGPAEFDYNEIAIKKDGKFIVAVTIGHNGKAFVISLSGDNVEISANLNKLS